VLTIAEMIFEIVPYLCFQVIIPCFRGKKQLLQNHTFQIYLRSLQAENN
jgi:hypothetical protein